MKKTKFLLVCVLIFTLIFSIVPYSYAAEGTAENPWKVGKTSKDEVVVYYDGNMMWLAGRGEMKDFNSPEDCPWKDAVGGINLLFVEDEVVNIGKNAFAGLGSSLAENDYCDLFIIDGGALETIGESAFENARVYGMQHIPSTVKRIEKKAFANTSISCLEFWGNPSSIAKDAFENVKADFLIEYNTGWTDFQSQYGGKITYKNLYRFSVTSVYGEESGFSSMLIPEGEEVEYFADSYEENYGFDHYELVSGDFELKTPANAYIKQEIHDNAELRAVYKKGKEQQQRPINDKAPCPFVLTRDGDALVDGSDYYWSPDQNSVIIASSGITVSMADGVESTYAIITVSFEADANLTLDNIKIHAKDTALGLFSAHNVKLKLVGKNEVASSAENAYAALFSETVTFDGDGSLYITNESQSGNSLAVICTGDISSEEYKILGSKDSNAQPAKLELITYDTSEDTYSYRTGSGDLCKTIMISGKTKISPVVFVVGGIAVAAAVFGITYALTKKKTAELNKKK